MRCREMTYLFGHKMRKPPPPTQSSPMPTQSATQFALPLTVQEVSVVEILKGHPKYSRADIADALGWKRDLVGYYLQRLKTKGVIARMGSNRKGYWIVKV